MAMENLATLGTSLKREHEEPLCGSVTGTFDLIMYYQFVYFKGEGHSKKRICFATTNKKFILS